MMNQMNCHGNHGDNGNRNEKGHKGHSSHMLMMVLCCGAPIMILLLLPLIAKIGGSGTATFLSRVAPFLCPLMMIFMIPMMFKGVKGKEDKEVSYVNQQVWLEEKISGE
jgi:hypothetical protein